MTTTRTKLTDSADGKMFDNPDKLVALAQASFAKAKDEAIAENDRLGIPSYGALNGKLVVRKVTRKTKASLSAPLASDSASSEGNVHPVTRSRM